MAHFIKYVTLITFRVIAMGCQNQSARKYLPSLLITFSLVLSADCLAADRPLAAAKYPYLLELGNLGGKNAHIHGISADGSVVVGSIVIADDRPRDTVHHVFRWSHVNGVQDLGTMGGESADAASVSADGSVVVGSITIAGGAYGSHSLPFRWSQVRGAQELDTIGGESASADSVSADGSIIVGSMRMADGRDRVYRWTQTGGTQDLGTLGGKSAYATGVSADGLVIVGSISMVDGSYHIFRWSQVSGAEDLGTMGGKSAGTRGASADGSVIVGEMTMADGSNRVFRWSRVSGAEDLGTMGSKSVNVGSVSADGSIIVGSIRMADGSLHVFRWTQASGTQDLGALGGKSAYATGVSADGSVIVGSITMADGNEHPYVAPINKNGQVVLKGALPLSAARPLCRTTETTVFSCKYKNKVASVCASFNSANVLEYVQYRFGESAAEISIPAIKSFKLDVVNGYTTTGAYGGSETINFRNGEHIYQIVSIWDKGSNNADVTVFKKESKISSFKCEPVTDDRLLRSFIEENHLRHGSDLH